MKVARTAEDRSGRDPAVSYIVVHPETARLLDAGMGASNSTILQRGAFLAPQPFSGALCLLWRSEHLAVEEAKGVRRRVEDEPAPFARDDAGGQFAALDDISVGYERPRVCE